MSCIALTHWRGQRNQCGSIIDGRAVGDIAWRQIEEIATPQLDGTCAIYLERSLFIHCWIKLMLAEEILDSLFRQFDPQHLMASLRQPQQVQALAA
ncbi:hypothetical protein D3C76_1237060 [compost metagenome]